MTERYLVPAHGPDEKQLGVAIVASIEVAKKHGCSLTILVPALKYAENTILDKILGERFVRDLAKGKSNALNGIPVSMCSKRTINPHAETGVILSLWGGKDSLAKTDKAQFAKAIVALPWIPEDVQQWSKRWQPVELVVENA